MKDLPKVSAFEIEKRLNNFQERFYASGEIIGNYSRDSVSTKINKIFTSGNHVYKSRVRIYLDNDIIEINIIGKTKDYLLTFNGEKIMINKIKDIEKI